MMRPQLTRSLTAHLRQTEDHSSLRFHPDCPICRRDRLAGSLEGEALVSRRTQAAIAAGLLAFSTGGAPAALASPPDEVTEGTEEALPGDPNSSIDFELGGETVQLPDVVSPVAATPAPVADSEDAGPLERESAVVVSEPEPALVGNANPTPDEAPADTPPIPSQPVSAVTTPTAAPETPETKQLEAHGGLKPERVHRREAARHEAAKTPVPAAPARTRETSSTSATSTRVVVAQTAAPAAATADPAAAPRRVVAHRTAERAVKGERFHTVQQGESLWSIAADLLGEDAGVARIAREVHRLWELNDDRIGTGQPDLLFAGTRLRLR